MPQGHGLTVWAPDMGVPHHGPGHQGGGHGHCPLLLLLAASRQAGSFHVGPVHLQDNDSCDGDGDGDGNVHLYFLAALSSSRSLVVRWSVRLLVGWSVHLCENVTFIDYQE